MTKPTRPGPAAIAADARDALWPGLPLAEWQATAATLHMWLQIVGKTTLTAAPFINHWWHVAFRVTARGLTTPLMSRRDRNAFDVRFDFVEHRLEVRTREGRSRAMALAPGAVADFYREYRDILKALGIDVTMWPVPVEVERAIPFAEDREHVSYEADPANRWWRALVQSNRVFETFRGRFVGKSSPVHFFWGAPDLAVTRFSGRTAPPHPGGAPNVGDWVMREAYSHEVSSAGLWWGGGPVPEPIFYSYAYPEPAGYPEAAVRPAAARYDRTLREFVLPYEAVRTAPSPDDTLLEFLQSTYEAAADLARWDRPALERRTP